MKKHYKKLIMLMMVLVLVLSAFAGCQQGPTEGSKDPTPTVKPTAKPTDKPAASPTAKPTDPPADPNKDKYTNVTPMGDHSKEYTYSIAYWNIGQAFPEGEYRDDVYKFIQDKFNIKFTPVNMTWSDFEEVIARLATLNQLPDVFAAYALGKPIYQKLINDEMVRTLPADMSKYPTLKAVLDDPGNVMYRYPMSDPNGKFYAIPRMNLKNMDFSQTMYGCVIRTDWLEKVNLGMPTSFDEFYNVAKTFVEQKPGGQDTVGVTAYSMAFVDWLLLQFEPGASQQWVKQDDGSWLPTFATAKFKAGVDALRKLKDDGLLDPDLPTFTDDSGSRKVAEDKCGIYLHQGDRGNLGIIADKYTELHPGDLMKDKLDFLLPWKQADGKAYRAVEAGASSETFFKGDMDDDKLARILEFFDYTMGDPEGKLLRYGLQENGDYKIENGKVVQPAEYKNYDGTPIKYLGEKYPILKGALGSFNEWSTFRAFDNQVVLAEKWAWRTDKVNAVLQWCLANTELPPVDLRTGFVDLPSKAKATFDRAEFLTKVLEATDYEATYAAEVQSLMDTGYADLTKEMNEAMKDVK